MFMIFKRHLLGKRSLTLCKLGHLLKSYKSFKYKYIVYKYSLAKVRFVLNGPFYILVYVNLSLLLYV